MRKWRRAAAAAMIGWAACGSLTLSAWAQDTPAPAKPVAASAEQPLRDALQHLRQIKGSTLDPRIRAAALARAARVVARTGDEDTTRTLGRDAQLALREPSKEGGAALSEGAVDAVLAQAFAELPDKAFAIDIADRAGRELAAVRDPAVLAAMRGVLAQAYATAGRPDRAQAELSAARAAAAQIPPGRDQAGALALIAVTAGKLGDQAGAAAAAQTLRGLSAGTPLDQSFLLAQQARAEAAAGDPMTGRAKARDAAMVYDRSAGDANAPFSQRIGALSSIALAQFECGDRQAAAQTVRALQATANASNHPFDRFQGQLAAADALLQIDRPQQ